MTLEMVKILSSHYKGREGMLYYSEQVKDSNDKFVVFHIVKVGNINTTYIYLMEKMELMIVSGYGTKNIINTFNGSYPYNIYDKGMYLLLSRLLNNNYQLIINFAIESNMDNEFVISSEEYKKNPVLTMINILAHKDNYGEYVFNRGLLEKFMTSPELQNKY